MFLTPWQWNYLIRHARNAEHAGQLVTFALQWPVLNQNRQLTAGPASLDRAAAAEQFERLLRDLTACTCTYGLYRVPDAPGPYVLHKPPGIRRGEILTRCFKIKPTCPHHGDRRRLPTFSETAVTRDQLGDYEPPWSPWQTTLTDEETHDADPGRPT